MTTLNEQREEFKAYISQQKAKIDEAYSKGEFDEKTRDRLYNILGETEERNAQLSEFKVKNILLLEKLEKTQRKLEISLDNLSLQTTTILFSLECTLRELKEKTGR